MIIVYLNNPLGVVLYEMLTGQLPFEGENEFSTLQAIINDEPEMRVVTSKELEKILVRALAKNIKNRFLNITVLHTELNQLQDELLKMKKNRSSKESTIQIYSLFLQREFQKNKRKILISVSVVSFICCMFIFFILVQSLKKNQTPQLSQIKLAILDFRNFETSQETSYLPIGCQLWNDFF